MLDKSNIFIKQPTDEELLEEASDSIYSGVTDPAILRILHVRPEEIEGDIHRREQPSERDKQIADRNKQITERDIQIANLEKCIADQDKRIADLMDQMNSLTSLLAKREDNKQ